MNLSFRARVLIVIGVAAACALGLAMAPAIPQPTTYHHFADQRPVWGIANFADTVSNLPFLLVGAWGIASILTGAIRFIDRRERWCYLIFFAGVALTCIGSAYYHLAPDNDRLVWDRLPMTVGFTSLLAALIAERIDVKAGLGLLGPFLLVGMASVWYWHETEQWGRGDLRMYLFVQFFPALGIPLILWLFPARYTRSHDLLAALGFYVLAKVLEDIDKQIFGLGKIVSGHTLKHLAAAAATAWILRMLLRREPLRTRVVEVSW